MQTPNTLNITARTDVILNVTLEHDGVVLNPALIDNLQANLITGLGRKTPLETSTGIDYIVVKIPWVDGRLPGCYSLEITGSINDLAWSAVGKRIIRYTSATEIGRSTVDVIGDSYDVTMEVGYYYTDSPIDGVSATIDDGVGEPSVETSYIRRQLSFNFHNLKGEQGEQGPQGIQGPQGDSVIVGEGDLPLTHVLGEDNTKAMSQKGVTDLVCDKVGMAFYPALAASVNSTTGIISSSDSQSIWIAKVSQGDKLLITATNDSSKAFRVGFYPTKPAVGDTLSDITSQSSTSVKFELASPLTGYVCISHGNDYFSDHNIEVMQKKLSADYKESMLSYKTVSGKMIIYWNGSEYASSNYNCADYIDVEGMPYIIYPRTFSSSSADSGMAFYDADKVYITGQRKVLSETSHYELTKIAVPANAKYARFTLAPGTNDFVVPKQNNYTASTIRPILRYEAIKSNGEIAGGYYGKKRISTPRFIKINCQFSIISSEDVLVEFNYYDKDCHFIERATMVSVTANTVAEMPITAKAEYVKFSVYKDSEMTEDFDVFPDIQLIGFFPEKWDIFSARPLDSGYQRIAVGVRLTDPTCCDEESDFIQDVSEVLPDYGIICLPESYNNTGKPTRLIVYCHGAGTQYDTNVSRFDSNALEPDYWLAEGYAVMDIEGNPFDNVNDHNQMPQSMDCYNGAYLWVVDHYNIRRDGVLIGGRSMGGSCALNLIRRDCPIPVIACCSNVPGGLTMSNTTAVKKAFISEHYGFVTPDGFTWSNGALTDNEKQVILNNWDKFVRNNPTLAMILDLPQKESVMVNYTYDLFVAFSANLHAALKCPVKFFCCNADTVAPPDKCAKMLYNMLVNGGQRTEVRVFNSTLEGSAAHYYELRDPALRTTVVTKYGETMTNVPVVYVEMLRFWIRYEQE